MDENGRPLTAKEKRQEQLKLWETSCTNAESGLILNPKPKVKFNDGAVFLAACSSGDLEELKTLLGNGADINFANIDGLTALHTVRLFIICFMTLSELYQSDYNHRHNEYDWANLTLFGYYAFKVELSIFNMVCS